MSNTGVTQLTRHYRSTLETIHPVRPSCILLLEAVLHGVHQHWNVLELVFLLEAPGQFYTLRHRLGLKHRAHCIADRPSHRIVSQLCMCCRVTTRLWRAPLLCILGRRGSHGTQHTSPSSVARQLVPRMGVSLLSQQSALHGDTRQGAERVVLQCHR